MATLFRPRPSTARHLARSFATVSPVTHAATGAHNHKVVVVGAGAAGLSVSHQLLKTGNMKPEEIAIIDPAEWHHYQPGWTLVGAGLKTKQELRRRLPGLIDTRLKLYQTKVDKFNPAENNVTLNDGARIGYEHLVVVPGIAVNIDAIKGLPEALYNPDRMVSTIYDYKTCDEVYANISKFKSGHAIFTHPQGVIKCAGAPQKTLWLALDFWRKEGLYKAHDSSSPISIDFATGLPVMFGIGKYSAKLEELRKERGVGGLFQHDLIAIEGDNTAVFARPDGQPPVKKHFDFMHVVPKMGPLPFVKDSPIADAAGFVEVDPGTTRHVKYNNVWSCGDASSLPTSKTAAAVTAQAPIMVDNILSVMNGKEPTEEYDGYASCPLLTEYGKVLLCEFKYGGEPKETFKSIGLDQGTPRRMFYHMKKDFFPWVYYASMVKGTWGGAKGFRWSTLFK
ncbi:hypothetical protein MKZ38_007290 [Zalerion maritima]|uniref:FAD/NAD(P)-binding domain-containing protein n=1 Tax=Zalerion maritima TaxID=339359 RepID=A0AAD5WPV1_9PEZI|nr:hypothetical protein MKZ38_007290 [Zalerion maritima]